MTGLLFPLFLIVSAGIFQGTFGLGMKKFHPLSWGSFWLVFSLIGMLVLPVSTALILVPSVNKAVFSLPPGTLILSVFMGACWGVGSVMFGKAVNYVGLSLTYGISMGLGAVVGSLMPLFVMEKLPGMVAVLTIITGTLVMAFGVVLISCAGMLRDKESEGKEIKEMKGKFKTGLIFAILNGLFTALLNIGYAKAMPSAQAAIEMGVLPRNASIVPWVIVLFGGMAVNVAYAVYLLIKKGACREFIQKKNLPGFAWALATAVMWFAALMLYGQGAALMGKYGTVVGWTMFLALSLVVSNIWGLKSGEWTGFRKPRLIMMAGNGILLLSWLILGFANYLIE
ncbi:MAG: hypothetical protein A2W90_00435 [Bacteroidetes bacterium GWF2_42_66]|nr:MAG: hypothetical protein A2W92_18875 [Bacteroidetes bacterium GWA2_42_15]OFY02091.1 MAG: hypothetical protein A2W89_11625 [Bacteroidetes bacterium GWE2_42_39]OFY43437.1 MAG: hypothetical protein A2W90_00435 [Bacteroidetes bacterium GWF2_42_66]HBL76522.1 rhamnose/proton symporter RhaT [Prolixibacteraceae bacterium]HCR92260.1 rhamnose/proton symporter RhaT [Prolixibacteraceae bacterium]